MPEVTVVTAPISSDVSGVVSEVVSNMYEYPESPDPPSVAAVQVISMVLSVDHVEVVCEEEARLETVEGLVVSINTDPLEEVPDWLPTASSAFARKYQVPSAKDEE